jgi:hypothetical protein
MATSFGSQFISRQEHLDIVNQQNKAADPTKLSDFYDGFKMQNLFAMGAETILNYQDFPAVENYNPYQDDQLASYRNSMDLFAMSKSPLETESIIKKIEEQGGHNINSPLYWIGQITGFATDPSSALLFFKGARTAKIIGSVLTAEEIVKQNLDPVRDDSYLPWTIGLGYGLPALFNSFKTQFPAETLNKIKKYDESANAPKQITFSQEKYEKGNFIDPAQSSVGATVNPKNTILIPPKEVKKGDFINIYDNQGNIINVETVLVSSEGTAIKVKLPNGKIEIVTLEQRANAFTNVKDPNYVIRTPNVGFQSKKISELSNAEINLLKEKLEKRKLELEQKGLTGTPLHTDLIRDLNAVNAKVDKSSASINFIDPAQSSVGATVSPKNTILTPKAEIEGEQFIKSNLGVFGEDGPWTPVFRLQKSPSQTAVKMNGDILDTPLLKLKNTKQYGFKATDPSLEIQLKMREAPVVEAQLQIRDLYLKYLESINVEKPLTEVQLNFVNRLSNKGLTMKQFNHEITVARLNDFTHSIPEIAEAARITEKLVYGPIGKEMNELGLKIEPALREQSFWESILTKMNKEKSNTTTFTSAVDGKKTVWVRTQVENQIKKIEDRLAYEAKSGGLKKNYINIVYNKPAIDANKNMFRKIVKEDLIKQGRYKNEAALDKLVDDLSNHFPFVRFEQTLASEAERFAFQRPRFARSTRARTLNLSREAQIQLLDNNFILSDSLSLMKMYYRQVTPDILLTKKYGDPNGLGYKFKNEIESTTSPGLFQVNKEFNDMLLKRTASRETINKQRIETVRDIEASIELLRGTYGLPSDPTKWFSQGMRMAKNYNALTMLTGFMAALPDVARVIMTSGVKRGFRTQLEVFTSGLKNNITKLSKAEANRFGEALDMITGQRAMIFADIGDMFGVYNKVESGMSQIANFNFMYVNLMSRWTEFAKSAASLTIGTRIIEDSILWKAGTLGDKWKTKLAASGIDEAAAIRIANQAEKYAEKTKYNYMPNTAKWEDDIAEQAFGAALNKDINITIVTPGKGDTPLWMSTELGSTISQFKKFAMGATQRMLMRGMQEKDMDFLFGSIILLGSGMMIDALYSKFRFNKDYSKISLTDKLIAGFDRSGLGGIYTDVNRSIETLTDNRFGLRPMLGAKKPYGTSLKNAVGLAGPTATQIHNIFSIMYDVGNNEYDHYTARNVRRLIPTQAVWYLDGLFDNIEKGLR